MKKPTVKALSYGVTSQPRTYRGMLRGVEKLVNAVRPTLGPYPRMVALASESSASRAPELLDDGGLIARRLIQLPDRDEDIGAMYLRHVLWRMREDQGDGTATLAVLFEFILRQGIKHIVNGGHAMLLKSGLEKGARLVRAELEALTRPVDSAQQLIPIAESICADAEMARLIADIFDTISEYGHFELREGQGRGLEREFVQGSYWEGPLQSKSQANVPGQMRAELNNCAVLVTDFMIEDMHELVHVITEAKKAGHSSLLLVCSTISEPCIGFLNMESTRKVLPVIAVKTPELQIDAQMAAEEDIATLTGAVPLTRLAGETLNSLKAHHFGSARSAWADKQYFGIMGGQGDPLKVRQHIHRLRGQHSRLETGGGGVAAERELIRQRIGRLMGGAAILWVGGAVDVEIAVRKDMAERAAEAVRGAMMKGVLPGGGMALLACKPALLRELNCAEDPDEKAAYRILLQAMDAPLRAIAANAGFSPDEVMAEVKLAGQGHGYDVRRRQVVSMETTQVVDAASVVTAAAYRAIKTAGLLLTVDVLIHHKDPETVTET